MKYTLDNMSKGFFGATKGLMLLLALASSANAGDVSFSRSNLQEKEREVATRLKESGNPIPYDNIFTEHEKNFPNHVRFSYLDMGEKGEILTATQRSHNGAGVGTVYFDTDLNGRTDLCIEGGKSVECGPKTDAKFYEMLQQHF